MTTLQALGFTFMGGSVLGMTAIGFFGLAMKKRHHNIAPRCTARHKNTIYNPDVTASDVNNPQYRGGAWLGWIPWVLSLSYREMLNGIPGTGTRNKGHDGITLRVNLDAIVLLKFHALGLRISILAAILFLLFLTPVYYTARCYEIDDELDSRCTYDDQYNLTYYDRLTIANIPALVNIKNVTYDNDVVISPTGQIEIWGRNQGSISARMYAVVLLTWILFLYTCYELQQEWIEILAMRRVYYLEYDHFNGRKKELKRAKYYHSDDGDESINDVDCDPLLKGNNYDPHHDNSMSFNNDNTTLLGSRGGQQQQPDNPQMPPKQRRKKRERKSQHLMSTVIDVDYREPWIPHPEQRETIPNISLYSVLVGGLPSLPSQEVGQDLAEEAVRFSAKQNVDWQLDVASSFFDHCVPNQPGFSSSVAAVTMLPGATEISQAWSKWFIAAGKLRRLRFIRRQIAERRHYEIDHDDDDEEINELSLSHADIEQGTNVTMQFGLHNNNNNDTNTINSNNQQHDIKDDSSVVRRREYTRKVLGGSTEEHVEDIYLEALHFGPEQTAVYSREFAQSAAACCPNGCFEGSLTRATLDDLLEFEKIALEEVHAANLALKEAQFKASVKLSSIKNGPTPDELIPLEKIANKLGVGGGGKKNNNDGSDTNGFKNKNIGMEPITEEDAVDDNNQLKKRNKDRKRSNSYNGTATDKPDSTHIRMSTMEGMNLSKDLETEVMFYERGMSKKNLENSAHRKKKNSKGATSKPERQSYKKVQQQEDQLVNSNSSSPVPPLFAAGKGVEISIPASSKHQHQKVREVKTALEASNINNNKNNNDHNNLTIDTSNNNTRANQPHVGFSPVVNIANTNQQALPNNGPDDANLTPSHSSTQQFSRPTIFDDSEAEGEGALLPENFTPLAKGVWFRPAEKKDTDGSDIWDLVDIFVRDAKDRANNNRNIEIVHKISTGQWNHPSIQKSINYIWIKITAIWNWTFSKSKSIVVDSLNRESTYAVVTFTSRQAALAARQCLADGRGFDRWITFEDFPIPPLADAAPFAILPCRGCCRPVTINIDDRQKTFRNLLAMAFLGFLFFFYSFPIAAASTLVAPDRLNSLIPALARLEDGGFARRVSGLVVASLWALFFSICPVLFKMIANFGSTATSVPHAEFKALQYYWWFMIVTAFAGSALLQLALQGFSQGIEGGIEALLTSMADSIPTTQAVTWMNWIILRFTVILPWQYMLQVNTFLFDWLNWRCCARMVRGGGPGGPTPYRIYVDSGVVLLCVFSLGPASPLVTPCAVLYFLVVAPLLRRNVIFMYRPKYDIGGGRWPFLFDVCVSSMLLSQIILTTMMALRQAPGPAAAAAIPFVPTVLFRMNTRRRFLRGFQDASLLQMSLLDGWDTSDPQMSTMEGREEFRRFLVDAHKAAYVPVCIAGTGESIITTEPAVVVPADHDIDDTTFHPDETEFTVGYDSFFANQDSIPNSTAGSFVAELGTGLGNYSDRSTTERVVRMSNNSDRTEHTARSTLPSTHQFGASFRRLSHIGNVNPQAITSSVGHHGGGAADIRPRRRASAASLEFLAFNEDGSVSLKSPHVSKSTLKVPMQSNRPRLASDLTHSPNERPSLTRTPPGSYSQIYNSLPLSQQQQVQQMQQQQQQQGTPTTQEALNLPQFNIRSTPTVSDQLASFRLAKQNEDKDE